MNWIDVKVSCISHHRNSLSMMVTGEDVLPSYAELQFDLGQVAVYNLSMDSS